MKAVGLVVEYNPFHNGHLYHLQSAKRITGADIVIAVMSGNFLQRGEMAIVDKWSRARVALEAGVDIIIELPPLLAVQPADLFADAAVRMLHATCCSSIVFGSESGDIKQFTIAASTIAASKDLFNQLVHEQMTATGASYPSAAGRAMKDIYERSTNKQTKTTDYTNVAIDLSSPNNNLGYHYVAAIQKHQFAIEPQTISRLGAAYHATEAALGFASATSIRQSIFAQGEELARYAPLAMRDAIAAYARSSGMLHQWEAYWPFLQYKIISSSPQQLSRIYEMKEGIEYRLLEAARAATTFTSFIEKVKTKRYSWTRLQRLSTYLLLNIETAMVAKHQEITSLRLLGATPAGRAYLRENKQHFHYPIVSKASDDKTDCFKENLRFNQIYTSIFASSAQKQALQREFASPIML